MKTIRILQLACLTPKEEEFNLHRKKRNGVDVCGSHANAEMLPIHWDSYRERKRALGQSLVSIKAAGKEIEKHINCGVCKEYREAY